MPAGTLTIDLDAIAANWRALDALSGPTCETAAVIKADAYGLGLPPVATRLAQTGARTFFTATAAEGAGLRRALGPGPRIHILYGHMAGDASTLRDADLIPMLTGPDQVARHREALPGHPFGVQLDTGMSRLGLTARDWAATREAVLAAGPTLVMSHLASADDPDSDQSARQRAAFHAMTEGVDAPRSLAATGGTLLGAEYHFDMVRPGVGLYGGAPYVDAHAVVTLDLPVVACFDVEAGAHVGYNATWTAPMATRLATVAGGYADGLMRALQPGLTLFADGTACPAVGRVSMDLITVDIGALDGDPAALSILGAGQGIDALAATGGTTGYEVLTSLGARYHRSYRG